MSNIQSKITRHAKKQDKWKKSVIKNKTRNYKQ